MKKLFTLMFLTLGLNACSSISYMDATDLKQIRDTETIYDHTAYSNNDIRNIKSLGALSINRFNEETGEREPALVDLKRNKSRFYAETTLFESDNKEKSTFDQTIFNIGVDKKDKGLNMELTLKF